MDLPLTAIHIPPPQSASVQSQAVVSQPSSLRDVWAAAIESFRNTLSPAEFRKLESVDGPERLVQELATSSNAYRARKLPRLLDRLNPVIQQLKFFTQSISILVSSHPEVAALVWGSMCILLQLSTRHQAHLDSILDILEHLRRHLPRVRLFTDLLIVSKRIEAAVCGLYGELVNFFLQATIFLNTSPVVNLFGIELPWKRRSPRFRAKFDQSLEIIRAYTQWIDIEANVGLHAISQQLTTKSHREILDKISTMSSSQPTPPPVKLKSGVHRMIPHAANPSFFGREAEMKQMFDTLMPKNQGQLKIFSIVGDGGVGKSQLALHFAYSYIDEFDMVSWVPSETPLKICQAYEEISIEVGLVQPGENQGSLEAIAQTTKKWLRNQESSCLLIFDNTESMKSLQKYLPSGGRCSIIITTRNQNLTQPPVTAWTHLKCFDIDEGKKFMLKNMPQEALQGSEKDASNAEEICKACGGLPLAMTQVLRFIQSLNISLAEANTRFSRPEVFVTITSELNQINQPDYYHQTGVPMLWDQPLQSLNPSSSIIVRLFAHLDPDGIPKEFIKLLSKTHFKDFPGDEWGPNLEGHLMTLLDTSLILKASKSGTFSMHRLLQESILQRLDAVERADLFRTALDIIDEAFPDYDDSDRLVKSWPECKLVSPHVIRIASLFHSAQSHDIVTFVKLGELLERAAWYLQERGARKEAVQLLQHALHITDQALQKAKDPESHENSSVSSVSNASTVQDLDMLWAAITNSIGTIELNHGHFDKARQLFTQAISKRESMGINDIETIYMKRNVGIALLSENRNTDALEAFRDSLKLLEMYLAASDEPGKYRYELAVSFGLFSHSLVAMNKLDEAWDAATKFTELMKSSYGLLNPRMGDCYTILGKIRLLQGDVSEAEIFLRQALETRVETCGHHEETALSMHNYAGVLHLQGKKAEALDMAKKGVELLRQLPDSKPILARSLFYLSKYKFGQVTVEDSMRNETEAFELYIDSLGITKDRTALTLQDYDNLLVAYNR